MSHPKRRTSAPTRDPGERLSVTDSTPARARGAASVILAGALLAVLGLACASDRGAPPGPESGAQRETSFEQPAVQAASELWPPAIMRGESHEVEEAVALAGFLRTYRVHSDFGDFEVVGDDLLITRIREIEALAALHQMRKTAEFAKAAARALNTPFVATWNLVTDPVDTAAGVPSGAVRFVARAPGLARRERGELEDPGLGDLVGFGAKKRELAYLLKIDPYSSNAALQRELNRHAWAAYAGGLPFNLAPFLRGEKFTDQIWPGAPQPSMRELLRSRSPEELRTLTRDKLRAMGVPHALRERFARHPWYSPRHHLVIVEALSALEVTAGRSAFVEVALTAESESDARQFERAAEMLRHYYGRRIPLQTIIRLGSFAAAHTPDRRLVVPLAADHVVWTREAERLAQSLLRELPRNLEVRGIELLIAGSASERARAEFAARDIELREGALRPGLARSGIRHAAGREPPLHRRDPRPDGRRPWTRAKNAASRQQSLGSMYSAYVPPVLRVTGASRARAV